MTSLPGRVSLSVSTPAGQSCTIAALASGRVDQLHGAIERVLKIPRVVQRLIWAGREIYGPEFLAELQLEDGSVITVIKSWPQKPGEIVEKLHLAASCTPTHALAAAVVQCLEHEDGSVKVAALDALSWMGRIAIPHAAAIAGVLRDSSRGVRSAAAEALSWLEEAGAAYAGDILACAFMPLGRARFHFQHFSFLGKAKSAIMVFFESELPSTRLTALESVVKLLEDSDSPATPLEKLYRNRFLVPYLCRSFFDPSPDVRQAAAVYLTNCVPVFNGAEAAELVPTTLTEDLICQFLWFGECISLDPKLDQDVGIADACKDISRKLDGHWPKWAGWQEGLDDPDTSLEAAACEVSVAMVHYLRRRFCEWQHRQQGPPTQRMPHHFAQVEEVRDLVHVMVEDGLRSRKWQVRQAVVESLMSAEFEPWGANAIQVVMSAEGKEKDKQVLETMARYFAKFGKEVGLIDQLFYYFDAWEDWYSDYDSRDDAEILEEQEELYGKKGYAKSHLSRSARHNKKHGIESTRPPSTIARQKKYERRTRPEETRNFSGSKRKNQKDKEQDRQLKTAMLGQELLRFAMDPMWLQLSLQWGPVCHWSCLYSIPRRKGCQSPCFWLFL